MLMASRLLTHHQVMLEQRAPAAGRDSVMLWKSLFVTKGLTQVLMVVTENKE
jgi:hypothetical protein